MKKAILAIFLAAVCSVMFYGVSYLRRPVNVIDADLVIYEQSADAEAIFIRDEKVYTSDIYGTVYNHYAEGSRIKNGALVSTVYNGTVSDETMQELRTIDKKIENVTKNGAYNLSYDMSSVSMESIINGYKEKIIEAGEENNISAVSAYKQIINNMRVGNASLTAQNVIDELNTQKEIVENRIGVSRFDIYSDRSGIFTTVLDGLESYLTPELAMNMTVSDFDGIKVNNSEAVGNTVSAGGNVCKISNNHEWYVLVCAPAEKVKDYNVGDSLSIRFESIPGEQVACKTIHKSEEENGKVLMLLMSEYYLEGAYSFRESNATLVLKSYTGYKVPIHSLRTENNVTGILAEKNNEQKFYPCSVLYTNTDEGFAIVNDAEGETSLAGIQKIVVGER